MKINLNPKLENFIQQQVELGNYKNVDSLLEEALTLLIKRNQYDNWVKEIGEKVDIAAAQLEQGEGVDGETAIKQLRQELKQS